MENNLLIFNTDCTFFEAGILVPKTSQLIGQLSQSFQFDTKQWPVMSPQLRFRVLLFEFASAEAMELDEEANEEVLEAVEEDLDAEGADWDDEEFVPCNTPRFAQGLAHLQQGGAVESVRHIHGSNIQAVQCLLEAVKESVPVLYVYFAKSS